MLDRLALKGAWPETVPRRRAHAAVSLVVCLLLYLLPTLLLPLTVDPIDAGLRGLGLLGAHAGNFDRGFAAAMVLRWFAVLLLLLYVPLVERESLGTIGIRMPRMKDLLLGLVAAALTIVVGGGIYILVHGPGVGSGTQNAEILATLGVAGRLQVVINAAVVEELLFRALLIERMIWLTGRRWPDAILSVILFAGSHWVTGSETLLYAVIVDGVAGILFVALYLLRRNVFANALAHAITDLFGLVVLPLLIP